LPSTCSARPCSLCARVFSKQFDKVLDRGPGRDGRRIDYTYDNANRLTQETWVNADSSIADILTYVYDANGNLTQASNKAGTYTLSYDCRRTCSFER
jgi:hypothetical protein